MNSPEPSAMIRTKQLGKLFGSFVALADCTLDVQQGEVFGLLGPNGAGKSTLIRTLLGFLNPTSGSAAIGGLDCQSQKDQVHRMVSYIPGDARLFRMMRGKKVLQLFCQFRQQRRESIEQRLAKGYQLAEFLELDLKRWVGLMSTGMRQKLAIVVCFMADSEVLILDEPTANLDPTVRGRVIELVAAAKLRGQTVLFSSHVLSEIEDVCDRVAILRSGQLVHQAPMSEIKLQHRIRAKIQGSLPPVPSELADRLTIERTDDQIQIDTADELRSVLKWLADAPLIGMHVQPIGLRSIYDRYHRGGNAMGLGDPEIGAGL